jgi:hypothetical protein
MLKRWLRNNWPGGLFLLVAFVIGLTTLFWGTFGDEGDNLATGLMLSRGAVLYRDIFSHHFPLAYYWIAVVTGLFGPSIAAARISILFFQIGSFAWAMYLTRYIVPVGSLCVLWSIVGLFFLSNLVLYTGFCSIALMVIFIVTIAILSKRIAAGQKELLTLGLFATIAVLSDPLAIYPVLCLLIFLALSPVRLKGTVLVGGFLVTALGLYGLYLFASGSAGAFYQDAIRFNAEVYNKYVFAQPLRITNILSLAGSALNLGGTSWQTDPLMPLQRAQLTPWLFTGFLFRVTILVIAFILLLRRRFVLAGFVYLYAVALLVMNQDTFRLMPFAMTAGFAGMWLVFENLDDDVAAPPALDEPGLRGKVNWLVLQFLPWSARCLIGCGFAWLLLRSTNTLIQNQRQISYESSFAYHTAIADHIRNDLACGQSDVSLAYYPGEPTYNYLTGLPPVSRYFYLFPWVAEVAQPEVIRGLSTGKAVVYVDWQFPLWGIYWADTYLAPLKTYLETNYQMAEGGFYVSPELARKCPSFRSYPQASFRAEVPDGEIIPGRKYFQTFTSECAGLSFLEILPATYTRAITSTLNVRIRDLDADQQLFDRALPGADITDSQWLRVSFDPLPDSKGKHYRISLSSADARPGNAFGVWRTATDAYSEGEAAINSQPLQADLVFRYGCRP